MKAFLTMVLALCSLLTGAQTRYAVVNVSANYLRSAPDYESSLETQLLMGTVVEIIGSDRYWRQVISRTPEYCAWTNSLTLTEMSEAALREYEASPKLICTTEWTRVYERASLNSQPLRDLVMGDIVRCDFTPSGNTASGPWTRVLLPDGQRGFVPTEHLKDYSRTAAPSGRDITATAQRFLGVPYLWGGNCIKGTDCSGLVWNVFFMHGIMMPRNAGDQAKTGSEVPLDRLKPGDLVFFGTRTETGECKVTHVGIALGKNRFIHSSQLVRISSFEERTPLFARRVIG